MTAFVGKPQSTSVHRAAREKYGSIDRRCLRRPTPRWLGPEKAATNMNGRYNRFSGHKAFEEVRARTS